MKKSGICKTIGVILLVIFGGLACFFGIFEPLNFALVNLRNLSFFHLNLNQPFLPLSLFYLNFWLILNFLSFFRSHFRLKSNSFPAKNALNFFSPERDFAKNFDERFCRKNLSRTKNKSHLYQSV